MVFHFRTFRVGADGESTALLDDTREIGNGPFELIIGRSFKLKIWEELIRGMSLNEISKFTCEPEVSNGATSVVKHHLKCTGSSGISYSIQSITGSC